MTWTEILDKEHKKPYYADLYNFVQNEYATHTVYPPAEYICWALGLTPFENVKCVIIGQDPYHEPGQAMGLCFSVPDGIPLPPSLQNICTELHNEFGYDMPQNGDLTHWANQGVLLLNAVLTVRAHQAASHRGKGWETYTDAIIQSLNAKTTPVVFLLWGSYARNKKTLITNPSHLILEAPHPSPLSAYRGFFGCGHFKKCNDYLVKHGIEPIDWRIQ